MDFLKAKSPSNKNTIKLARNELIKSPIKYRERRKSFIPQNALAFIRNNYLNQVKPQIIKYSCKDYSAKKKYLKEISNTNIPEESGNFNKTSIIMVKDMKEILEMINMKEKEYIILIMVIDMKEILKMVQQKEKEYIIIIMVIDMREIGKME